MSPVTGAASGATEIDVGAENNAPAPPPPSALRRRARKNYFSALGLGYALAIASPGTVLWPSSCLDQGRAGNPVAATSSPVNASIGDVDAHRQNVTAAGSFTSDHSAGRCAIDVPVLAKLTCSVAALIAFFWHFQGSDPGVLTSDVLRRLDAFEGKEALQTDDGDGDGLAPRDEEAPASDAADDERDSFLEPSPSSPSDPPRPRKRHGRQRLYPHARRKYCRKCRLHPPLRSHHCRATGRCVATFDHHCRFLDTTIGERNHFRFWAFLSLNLWCLHIALGVVGTGQVDGIAEEAPASWLLQVGQTVLLLAKCYLYPTNFIVWLLWMIHTVLALGNTTTFEMGAAADRADYLQGTNTWDLPFGRGPRHNLRVFFTRDDACRRIKTWCAGRVGWRPPRDRGGDGDRGAHAAPVATNAPDGATTDEAWIPVLWKMPDFIERDSEDWYNHPWQNKYWSCC